MRKFLFFWVSLLFLTEFKAQNTNFASHSNVDRAMQPVCINSNSYFIEQIDQLSAADSANIVGVNTSGKRILKRSFIKDKVQVIVALKATLDKALAFILYTWGCDVGARKCYFVKIDTLGNQHFNNYLPALNGVSYTLAILDFTQHLDSSFYMVSDSVLFHVAKDGTYLSKTNTGMTDISTINSLPNGNLLIAGKMNNVNKLVEFNFQNNIVNQQTVAERIKKLKISANGQLIALTASSYIRSYSPNLNALLCSSITIGPSMQVNDFDLKDDTLYITGINYSSNQLFYGMLDQNFQYVYQTQSGIKFIRPVGITVNSQNRVSVLSNCTSTNKNYSTFISVHQFYRFGNFQSKFDIGVSNVALINYSVNYNTPFWLHSYYDFMVTVKNYGNDTIRGFKLNKFLYDGWICERMRFNKFYNVTILPFDSVIVTTAPFMDIEPSPAPLYSKNICFFTTIPNASNDIETNNDEFCKTISFPVGIAEYSGSSALNIHIFPNPFSSAFTIQAQEELRKILVFDAMGLLVYTRYLTNKDEEIELHDLSKGLYFIRIETEKGWVIKKAVKY
jgi:hypothetical protein